jgi:hypothetical protein
VGDTFKMLVSVPLLLALVPVHGFSQQGPAQARDDLMGRSLCALMEMESVRRLDRPVAADTFGFGSGMESRQEWRRAGGPEWMRRLAGRLGLAVDGRADPGGMVLITILAPEIEGREARVPGIVAFRVRDLETGELVERVCMHTYYVRFTREADGWGRPQLSQAVSSCRGVLEARRQW